MSDVNFIHTHSNGDATSNYDVEINGCAINTIGDFVDWVLSNRSNEWGDFRITIVDGISTAKVFYEYKYGRLVDEIPNDILSLPIPKKFYANGGWTNMSYLIKLDDKLYSPTHTKGIKLF